jgi:PAS domain-containing protein
MEKTLDTIPQMVWTMAADGSDEFYNAQWEKFTGLPVQLATWEVGTCAF